MNCNNDDVPPGNHNTQFIGFDSESVEKSRTTKRKKLKRGKQSHELTRYSEDVGTIPGDEGVGNRLDLPGGLISLQNEPDKYVSTHEVSNLEEGLSSRDGDDRKVENESEVEEEETTPSKSSDTSTKDEEKTREAAGVQNRHMGPSGTNEKQVEAALFNDDALVSYVWDCYKVQSKDLGYKQTCAAIASYPMIVEPKRMLHLKVKSRQWMKLRRRAIFEMMVQDGTGDSPIHNVEQKSLQNGLDSPQDFHMFIRGCRPFFLNCELMYRKLCGDDEIKRLTLKYWMENRLQFIHWVKVYSTGHPITIPYDDIPDNKIQSAIDRWTRYRLTQGSSVGMRVSEEDLREYGNGEGLLKVVMEFMGIETADEKAGRLVRNLVSNDHFAPSYIDMWRTWRLHNEGPRS